jgi:hypothetical protein
MNATDTSKEGYLLMLHSNDWWTEVEREELERRIAQNNAWLEQVMATGKIRGGQALARSGAMVSGNGGCNVTDGPFAEAKEVVGGFLVLNVETLDEAVAVAQGCPCLAFGGKVEIRPLTDMCPAQMRLEELTREQETAAA